MHRQVSIMLTQTHATTTASFFHLSSPFLRIMEAFAGHLYEHLGPGRPFATADAAYILAFSTIMLNTDLHNPQIPQSKKMTKYDSVFLYYV